MKFGETMVLVFALGLVLTRGSDTPPVEAFNSSTLREYIINGSDPIDEDVEARLISITT